MNYWKSKGILKQNLFSNGKTSVEVCRLDALNIKASQNTTCSETRQASISGHSLTFKICTESSYNTNFSLRKTTKQIVPHPHLMPSNNSSSLTPTSATNQANDRVSRKNPNNAPQKYTNLTTLPPLFPPPPWKKTTHPTPGKAHRPYSSEVLRLVGKLRILNLHIMYSQIQWSEQRKWPVSSGTLCSCPCLQPVPGVKQSTNPMGTHKVCTGTASWKQVKTGRRRIPLQPPTLNRDSMNHPALFLRTLRVKPLPRSHQCVSQDLHLSRVWFSDPKSLSNQLPDP